MSRRNLLLLAAAVVLGALPLFMGFDGDTVFAGADGEATAVIDVLRPDYRPWAVPMWQPPSKEIESLLFALQAALGAGLLGYWVGLRRGQRKASAETRDARD